MNTNILITSKDVMINATLNDTVSANEFKKQLPLEITMKKEENHKFDGEVECGVYDPMETQNGWKNGDLNLSCGLFSILFGGSKHSKDQSGMMIIGNIDEDQLDEVSSLPENVTLTIELA